MTKPPESTWYDLSPPLPSDTDRRRLLQGALAGGIWIASGGTALPDDVRVALTAHTRTFFTDAEWVFVLAACSRLIPSAGEGPGALETLVPIFIDRQLSGEFGNAADWYMQAPHSPTANPMLGFQSPLTPAQIYRAAILAIDTWSRQQAGKAFAALDVTAQDEALRMIEAGKVGLAPELRDFFSLLLQNTKEGYFADPLYGGNHKMAAWVHIGFPGARGSFKEWAEKGNVRYPLGPVSISGMRA
jgi:gluconate 2-dehydrogenase gamma chain